MVKKIGYIFLFFTLSYFFFAVPSRAEVFTYDAQETARLLEKRPGEFVIIDLRTPTEYKAGHLPGAILVSMIDSDFEAEMLALNMDRNKNYLVYCRTNKFSTMAIEIMRKLGFKNIHHMNTGFNSWVVAGFPIEKLI